MKEQSSTTSQQNVGGSKTSQTTYSYKREWSAISVDSGHFKVPAGHQNPPMRQRSATFDGGEVKLGAYRLDPSVLDKVNAFTPLRPQSPPPAAYQVSGDGFYRGTEPG